MRERVPDGRRKLDVVLDAVRAFAGGMRLNAGQDRAAIVAFNAGATLVQPLTHRRDELDAALGRVQIAQYSRLDLGIERAATELLVRGRAGR